MASGPAAREQLEADLGHAGTTGAAAGPAAWPRRGRRRRGPGRGGRGATVMARSWWLRGRRRRARPTRGDAVAGRTIARRPARTLAGRPRIGEGRRADLDGRWRRPAAARPRPRRRRTPPTPTIGQRRACAAWTSNTARTATGWMAGPDRPPPRPPSTGRRVSTSMAMPSTVFTSVTASAPASAAAAAMSARSAAFGLSLAQRGRPHERSRRHGLRGRLRRVGEHAPAVLEVRAAHVHLDRHDAAGALAQQLGRGGELVDGAAPDAGHHPGPGALAAAGSSSCQPGLDARALRARRSSASRAAVGCSRGAGLPAQANAAERLHHDRPEARRGRGSGPSSVPWPAVPDAVITGLGSSTDPILVGRSTGNVPPGSWRRQPSPAPAASGISGTRQRRPARLDGREARSGSHHSNRGWSSSRPAWNSCSDRTDSGWAARSARLVAAASAAATVVRQLTLWTLAARRIW